MAEDRRMGSRELPPAGSGELTSDESSGYDLGQLMELTPQERALLDEVSLEDMRFRDLDKALGDAMRMMRVSNVRVRKLRKMHAMVLLHQVKQALESYSIGDRSGVASAFQQASQKAGNSSDSDASDDAEEMRLLAGGSSPAKHWRRASFDKHKQAWRVGPDSDDFIPIRRQPSGGSRSHKHGCSGSVSRHGDFAVREDVFPPEDEDEDTSGTVYPADPYWVDSGVLPVRETDEANADKASRGDGNVADSDSTDIETGSVQIRDKDAESEASFSPARFARRFQRQRRINRSGAAVYTIWAVCCVAYLLLRVAKTLPAAPFLGYGVFVLLVEILGASATGIYGLNLIWTPINPELERSRPQLPAMGRRSLPRWTAHPAGDSFSSGSSPGIPAGNMPSRSEDSPGGGVEAGKGSGLFYDGGRQLGSEAGADADATGYMPVTGAYHIRVLIPTYKEPVDIVKKTVEAMRAAVLPEGCHCTIYVLDDAANRRDLMQHAIAKRRMCQRLGRQVRYVAGRHRPSGEMNGKSANLNNACAQIYPAGCKIPDNEVICVMDADQEANPEFFLRLVPMLDGGDDVGMVLSPQAFHNLNVHADIFNHSNIHFWEYMQPGYDALGFISCTGTNFLIRAKAFRECGWSPEYTLTEDFALGMELKMRHWQCRYVPEYLAVGEAPHEVRNCFQQRSRWCKGHFQVVFSKEHCPLRKHKLSWFMRVMFCSGVWSYIVASITTPTFIAVPLLTIWFGVFPIVLSFWAALGLTVYYLASTSVLMYTKSWKHIKPLWFSNISTFIMFWTYIKAFYRTMRAKVNIRFFRFSFGGKAMSFKTTLKGMMGHQAYLMTDLAVPTGLLLACAVSFGIGLSKVAANASGAKTTLMVSLAWMVFNMLPGGLLLHYTLIGRGVTLKIACWMAFVISILVNLGALGFIWMLYPRELDYRGAMGDVLTFFQSMMLRPLAGAGFGVPWRGPAFAQDATSLLVAPMTNLPAGAHDSTGGWMTGGPAGTVKMTQPLAFTTAMLAWGLMSFPQSYTGSVRTQTLQQIQVGTEYLKKMLVRYTPNSPAFAVVYQVGNISRESRYWGYPEAYTAPRPSFWVNSTSASDLTGGLSAAFAAASLAFKKDNPAYAKGLLQLASDTYLAAKSYQGLYATNVQGTICNTFYQRAMINDKDPYASSAVARTATCSSLDDAFNGSAIAWYNSTTYQDDLMWAATWMYEATKQPVYLNDSLIAYTAHTQGIEHTGYEQLLFNWQNTFWGANLKLAQLQGDAAYHQQMRFFLKYWICATGGGPIQFTPLGRAWNSNDGSLGTTANVAFLSAVYAQTEARKSKARSRRYVCFARSQTRYVLGGAGTSYLTGFGRRYSRVPQLMAASCPGLPFPGKAQTCGKEHALTKAPNPHTATGALLEQSSFSDDLSTVRGANDSRVAVEYDAGLLGALAGVLRAPGDWSECLQGNGVLSRDTTICLAKD